MGRYMIVLLIFLSFSGMYAQNEKFYEIEKLGKAYVKPIMEGHIENMKNANPPKDTWTYKKLAAYKDYLALIVRNATNVFQSWTQLK